MKKSEGITLISLVITIIILLILASVATYSGMNVVNSSKLTAFTTELKIMQTQVNAIYQEKSDSDMGEDISSFQSQEANKVLNEAGITVTDGYRYWSKQLIKQLGIEGVEQDFLVNVEQRSVVSYQGFEYKGKTYYTLDQLPNGLYNVKYENSNEKQEKPTFDVTIQCIGENKYRVLIQNVQYNGYIDKWEVNYQFQGESWKKTEDMSFVVNAEGTYKIKLTNGLVSSEEKECEIDKNEFDL